MFLNQKLFIINAKPKMPQDFVHFGNGDFRHSGKIYSAYGLAKGMRLSKEDNTNAFITFASSGSSPKL